MERIRTSYLQHPRMRVVMSVMALLLIATGVVMAGSAPRSADASNVMDVVKNGSFEGGFESQAGCGMVGAGWSCFTNGGAANYGFYDDMWEPVVADGKHSQLIEVNTKGLVVADADRYAGIYQTVKVQPGEVYKLSLKGLIRTTNFEGDPWRYRVEVGYTDGPHANWEQVKNWQDVGWDEYYPRTEPGGIDGFMGQIKAKEGALTLYIRVWKKWGVPNEEIDVNLDAVSLVGAGWGMGEKPMPKPEMKPMGGPEGAMMAPGQPMGEPAKRAAEQVCGGPNLIYNGSFEQGFNPATIGDVGRGWGSYTNGGAANYGFYDDMWEPVVASGKHAQLIEINTKGVYPADGDRYAGIYQRVGKLKPGQTYELTVRGVLRGVGGEQGDPNRWEAQAGINWGGDTRWEAVKNWDGMDLGGIQERTAPQSIGTYKSHFTAQEASMVLFLQGWFKWGETGLEMDLNFDDISLVGCETWQGEMKPGYGMGEPPMMGGGMKPEVCTVVVKPGDSLGAIAVQYDLSTGELARANGIENPNIIYVGQKLSIPGCGKAMAPLALEPMAGMMPRGGEPMMAPTRAQTMHRVKAGETLSGIGVAYGVDPRAVAEMNGLSNVNFLYVGQQLRMP